MGKVRLVISVIIAGMVFSGCSTVSDAILDGAATGLGRAVYERAENTVYKKLAPKEKLPAPKTPGWNQFMVLQAQIMFAYAYSGGGLWVGQKGYEPGEYTKFELQQTNEEEQFVIERALLKRTEDGNEWWRVSWNENEESWIYEAMIDTVEGKVIRLRAKDADGNEGEIPVTDDTYIYTEPQQVSGESIEGAAIGQESIDTPAGRFDTRHVRYMSTTEEGQIDWWITQNVPGGVVKYQLTDEDETIWTNTLKEMGSNAASVLGSF